MEDALSLMMPAVMIVTFLVVGGISFGVMRRAKEKELQGARGLAESLGLRLLTGEESFRAACEDAEHPEAAIKLERLPGPVARLAMAASPWRAVGERGGCRVAIYPETRSSGKSSTTYTVVRVFYREPLGFELSVQPEGGAFRLGKALFGLQDIELGDPELDPLVRIKSGDPLAARLLLGGDAVRPALLALASGLRDYRATRSFVHWERRRAPGQPGLADELAAVLDLLAPLAAALGGA